MARIIGTCFYHVDGKSPNIGKCVNKNEIYYRCMAVMFESARRFHPNAELVIYTDREIPDKFGIFKSLNVGQVIVEPIYYAPMQSSFPGCLFTLDVINYISGSKFDSICLVDSDCIFQSDINDSFAFAEQDVVSVMRQPYETNKDLNGYSISSLQTTFHIKELKYYGGEFYVFNKSIAKSISDILPVVDRFFIGKPFTEEHILSVILNSITTLTSKYLIKRNWTSREYSNTKGDEHLYKILHLPAEKDKLFQTKFKSLWSS